MDHLLTTHNHLQEIKLANSDFSWFTDGSAGSYLEGDKSKLHSGYTIATPFDVLEVTTLPKATSTQYIELYAFTKDRGTRDQTANICWIIEKGRVPENHLFLLY